MSLSLASSSRHKLILSKSIIRHCLTPQFLLVSFQCLSLNRHTFPLGALSPRSVLLFSSHTSILICVVFSAAQLSLLFLEHWLELALFWICICMCIWCICYFYISISICIYIHTHIYLYIHIYLSAYYLSTNCLFICLYVPTYYMFIHLSIHLSLFLPLPLYVSIYP